MLSLNSTQQTIRDASSKLVSWLFTVTTTDETVYRWATAEKTYGSDTFSAKILPNSFSGIVLNRAKSESGLQTPSIITFKVSNADGNLTADHFIDATVLVQLVVSDYTNEDVLAQWKFKVKRCDEVYKELTFEAEDFLRSVLRGDYPNTPLLTELFPTDNTLPEDWCVPVPIGTCFIPLVSVYSGGSRYYLLGPSDKTYTIAKVRSPRRVGYKTDWSSGNFSFNQSTITADDGNTYKVFQAIIADSDGDGTADSNGLFVEGDRVLPLPTKFSRDDTAQINGSETGTHTGSNDSATLEDSGASWGVDKLIGAYVVNKTDGSYGKITDNNTTTVTATLTGGTDNNWDTGDEYVIGGPASVIKWVLLDMGVSEGDIDDDSFGQAEKIFATTYGGLQFNGAFYRKRPREAVLAFLLNQCNARLVIRDKIYLQVYTKDSVRTITSSNVVKPQEVGRGTYTLETVERFSQDCGYIEFQPSDEIQDEWQRLRVSAKFYSGTHTDLDGMDTLIDSTKDWPVDSLVGGTVKNLTDGSQGTIRANTATAVFATLSGGTDNKWDNGDSYTIEVYNNDSGEVLSVHFIQNVQHAQRAGTLVFQRKFLNKARVSFQGGSMLLDLEPGDVITIEGTHYGIYKLKWSGDAEWSEDSWAYERTFFKAMIDSVTITPTLEVRITAWTYDA